MTHDRNDSENDISGEEPNEFTRLLPDSNWLEQTIPSLFVNDPELLDGPPSFKPPDSLVEQFKENSVKPAVPVSSKEFAAIIKDCIAAIKAGVYPTRITKGSSGSYFCKNTQGQIVGVFKPSSEEPYGNLNPKWTKWLHRNLLPCCFGREGIIPAVGYLSEAGASLIDRRLGLNVVPRTEIVRLASPTFHYTFKQRWAYRLFDRPLPLKTGSFQLFLNGFTDATTFFNEGFAALQKQQESRWDEDAQKQFQYGFERLTILDYLIRNTDRGSDNWMIKYTPREDAIEDEVPEFEKDDSRIFSGGSSSKDEAAGATMKVSDQEFSMNFAKITLVKKSDVSIGAIDNGLAFPTKHPNNFRSYPYAWVCNINCRLHCRLSTLRFQPTLLSFFFHI